MTIQAASLPRVDQLVQQIVCSGVVGCLIGVLFRTNPWVTASILCIQVIAKYVFAGLAKLYLGSAATDLAQRKIAFFSFSFVVGITALALYEFRIIGIFLFTLCEIGMVLNAFKDLAYIEQQEKKSFSLDKNSETV